MNALAWCLTGHFSSVNHCAKVVGFLLNPKSIGAAFSIAKWEPYHLGHIVHYRLDAVDSMVELDRKVEDQVDLMTVIEPLDHTVH